MKSLFKVDFGGKKISKWPKCEEEKTFFLENLLQKAFTLLRSVTYYCQIIYLFVNAVGIYSMYLPFINNIFFGL